MSVDYFSEMSAVYRQKLPVLMNEMDEKAEAIHRILGTLFPSNLMSGRFRRKSLNRTAEKDYKEYCGIYAEDSQVKDLLALRLCCSGHSNQSEQEALEVKEEMTNKLVKHFIQNHRDIKFIVEKNKWITYKPGNNLPDKIMNIRYIVFFDHIELQILTTDEYHILNGSHADYEFERSSPADYYKKQVEDLTQENSSLKQRVNEMELQRRPSVDIGSLTPPRGAQSPRTTTPVTPRVATAYPVISSVELRPETPMKCQSVHKTVKCDECGIAPIKGFRYKCTVRRDFDLCESCEAISLQPHPMVKMYRPRIFTQQSVHEHVRCDECSMMPIIGIRYKCTVRENFDLCEFCEAKSSQPHPMVKMYRSHTSSQRASGLAVQLLLMTRKKG